MQDYETSDLYLAAFLESKGMPIKSTRVENGTKAYFCFEQNEELKTLKQSYFSGWPSTFATTIKVLKARVQEELRAHRKS